MTMKSLKAVLGTLLLAGLSAQAGIYSVSSGTITLGIPDANPTGISSSINVSSLPSVIEDVNVWINVSGGYNGDLYAFLSYNGVLVPLLNRVGTVSVSPSTYQDYFGYSTAGFSSVMLNDQASDGAIHNTITPGSKPTYSYTPDIAGSASPGLVAYNSANPNGNWTIFFSDMASGNSSTLVSWGMDITAVPEPANIALGIFGASSMLVLVVRSRTVRSRVERVKTAWANWLDAA